jgi:iron-sulfur cluster repair protein YtfE (RIC family)
MDDLEFLADDHTLLSSQVIHVLALVRAIGEGRFSLSGLNAEIVRQTEILHSQLSEHFAFEEVTAFPHLEEKYPQFKSRLRAMLAQHSGVLDAFEGFRAVLNVDPSSANLAQVLERGSIFESAFEGHATEETQLLHEISASKVPTSESA